MLGGAPHLFAVAFAILGWHMVRIATAMGLLSAAYALRGDFAALLPLPLLVASMVIALVALREAAGLLRAVMRR